ncbi:ACP phosphodiesterase [candidate division KSB3 bacterium]|uniref:ACP phosphodiesterase n=1 Tax=candidate division KSB3 bacterium TaxID=2044937 RepID=A0A2G6KET4_9BACT|nr:MAG: ACP phosphodiesterase [candidate division KSB3 bacterium]
MNYVAHLFLAEPSDEHRIGSILADFTAGRIENLSVRYSPDIARGIQQHRDIDRFTDTHEHVLNSIACLKPDYGLFSGIVVDVCFDHFLIKHWDEFSEESLPDFLESIYRSLSRDDWDFPPRYRRVIGHMVREKWLISYRHIDNVGYALSRIGQRFSRKTPLDDAIHGIKACYQVLEKDFLLFFPELIEFATMNGSSPKNV